MNNAFIQGWYDFPDIYQRMVNECPPGGIIIELGVWKGASICGLGSMARAAKKGLRVFGVDNWTHHDWDGYSRIQRLDQEVGEFRSIQAQAIDNLKAYGLEYFVTLIQGDCIEAAKLFADGEVNFVFLDDRHNADHVKAEIAAWLPKMKRPTWMAGHDFPGIIEQGVRFHFPEVRTFGRSWVADLT